MLRTLTLKSQMKFGQFTDFTVAQMFQIKKQHYLRWVYYNSSNISFVPEILKELGITQFIDKPGVDRQLYENIREQFRTPYIKPVLTVVEASILKHKGQKTKNHKYICVDRIESTKRVALQAKNHNHTK